jgi:hypothetical protein
VYYIGGTGASGSSAEVSRATLGELPPNPTYPDDGWYFSAPTEIGLGGTDVKVKTIKWRALSLGGGDLILSYRVSTDPDCSSATQLQSASWTEDLDAVVPAGGASGAPYSQEGSNEVNLDSGAANCFQYRAKIVRGGLATTTPTLTRLSIIVERPGSADLKFIGNGVEGVTNSSGQLVDMRVRLTNENTFEPPTISADYGDGGSFTLDLFVFPQGVTASVPATDYENDFPSTNGGLINRSLMKVGNPPYIVTGGDARWQWTKADGTVVNGALNLAELFPSIGSYTVVAVVDGPNCPASGQDDITGCVRETAVGTTGYNYLTNNPAEANNVSAQVPITISAPPPNRPVEPTVPTDPTAGYVVNLPVVSRP